MKLLTDDNDLRGQLFSILTLIYINVNNLFPQSHLIYKKANNKGS